MNMGKEVEVVTYRGMENHPNNDTTFTPQLSSRISKKTDTKMSRRKKRANKLNKHPQSENNIPIYLK